MLDSRILMIRIAVGKGVGFVIGLAGLIFMPYFLPGADWMLRIGILFWYTTMGAIVALAGVFTWHPVLKIPFPWWFGAPVLGAWMNFVLTFFAYDTMRAALASTFGPESALSSPFWFTVEGAVVGFVIGYAASRVSGESGNPAGK